MSLDPTKTPAEQAACILGQMLKYTRQMAAFETRPDVDIRVLSEARDRRLADLKTVLPVVLDGPDQPGRAQVVELVKTLYEETGACSARMERKRDEVGGSMHHLTRTRTAIRAYK